MAKPRVLFKSKPHRPILALRNTISNLSIKTIAAVILRRMRKVNNQTRAMETVMGMLRKVTTSYRWKRRTKHVVVRLKRRRWQGNRRRKRPSLIQP